MEPNPEAERPEQRVHRRDGATRVERRAKIVGDALPLDEVLDLEIAAQLGVSATIGAQTG